MASNNGTREKVAVLATDIKYIKSSQEALEKAVIAGFKEIKTDLADIKQQQRKNADDILIAKSSIQTLKVVGGIIVGLITITLTALAAIW